MSRRTVVLLVALGLAAVAAFSVWRYLDTVESDIRSDVEEVVVYRAQELIEQGTDGSTALALIEPSAALAESVAFEGSTILCAGPAPDSADVDGNPCAGNPTDLQSLLQGTVAAGPISVGQLITTDLFVAPAELDLGGVSGDIAAGTVALAINPGDVGAVGGHIRAGDRVNVLSTSTVDVSAIYDILSDPVTRDLVIDSELLSPLLTTSPAVPEPQQDEDDEEEPATEEPDDPLALYLQKLPNEIVVTQTILQDIPVLAVGGETVASPAVEDELLGEAVIVVEVTPVQAERLEWARLNSDLGLALLPADEPYTPFAPPGATVDDIFDLVERLLVQLEAIDGG